MLYGYAKSTFIGLIRVTEFSYVHPNFHHGQRTMAIGWLLLWCLDGRRPRCLALVACGRCSLLLQLLPFLVSSSCHCHRRYVSLWHHHHRCCCIMLFVVASRRVMSSHHVLSFVVLLTWKEASQTSIRVQWTTTTTISRSNLLTLKCLISLWHCVGADCRRCSVSSLFWSATSCRRWLLLHIGHRCSQVRNKQ